MEAQAATEAAAPAAATADPGSQGLDALLDGDLSGEDSAAGDDALEALVGGTADEAPAADDAADPTNKAAKLDDEVIFSDGSLNTKDGLLKAKARMQDIVKEQYKKYLELKSFERRVAKRDEKLRHKIDKYVSSKRSDDILVNSVKGVLAEARSADPARMVNAIGQLYGMDGIKALELLNSELVNRGKSQVDPQVAALVESLKSEIAELKGGLTQRETQARAQQITQQLGQRQQQLGQQIQAQAAELPHLARLYADDPGNVLEHVTAELTELHQAGTKLDIRTYFGNLEKQLARHFGAGQAPQGDGGGPAPKQPSQAQRSPGQSVGPRTAAASNPRVPTEEEILRSLAADTDLLSQFGI